MRIDDAAAFHDVAAAARIWRGRQEERSRIRYHLLQLFPLGELNFRMENLILDDVNLFVVKGIKYRAMSSGIISGKPMHIIESVGSGVCWKN